MIEGILEEILGVMIDECPHRHCLVPQIVGDPLALVVAHKCSILASVDLNGYVGEHPRVELKH